MTTPLVPLLCDCAHGEKMGEYDPVTRKIIIRRIRRGEPHILVIEIDKLLQPVENEAVAATKNY